MAASLAALSMIETLTTPLWFAVLLVFWFGISAFWFRKENRLFGFD